VCGNYSCCILFVGDFVSIFFFFFFFFFFFSLLLFPKMDDLDFDLDELGEFDSMEEDDDSIEPVRGVLRDLLVANPFPVAEEVSAESLLAVVESSNSQSLSQILSERLLSLSVLRKVLFAVCNGPPKAFIAQNIKPRKSVCGKQWMRGEWLYHCKNCEKDPQCEQIHRRFFVFCFIVRSRCGLRFLF
jgi:hypothetical protein